MTVLAFYLLKVFLCSGVLFLYYLLALRNKLFHQWNRFYLLLSVVLSLTLPLLQFTIFFPAEQSNALQWLQTMQSADNYLQEIVLVSHRTASPLQWLTWGYGVVCLALLLSFLFSLFKIVALIRLHTVSFFSNVKFINTRVPGTPFSFFDYIFWNENISLQSPSGQQIFQHELVHVKEKHSLDKLFLQVVLVFFWCNPFFWLIRKELRFVHEFLADKKAVGEHGTAAFAAMILQSAYPQQFHFISNPFFQTAIKRRIAMLTKMQNPTVAYISRIVALPLIAITVLAFTVRTSIPKNEDSKLPANDKAAWMTFRDSENDTLPKNKKEIRSVDVRKNNAKKVSEITITYADGTKETMTGEEAQKRGLINNSGYGNITIVQGKPLNKTGVRITGTSGGEKQPLFILEGKEISKEEMSRLNPNSIQSINVLKGESAKGKYGEKGKNGVVEISLKKADSTNKITPNENGKSKEQDEVTVVGHPMPKTSTNTSVDDEKIFSQTETPASIDPQEWRAFLVQHLQPIIEHATKQGAKPGTYTIYIRFLVKKDGSLSDFTALNNPGYDFDKKILAVMPSSPKWKPAVQNGKLVNSYHTQPVTFVIQEQ